MTEKDLFSFAREYGISDNRATDTGIGVSPIGPSRRVKTTIRKAVKEIGVSPDPLQTRLRGLLVSKYGVRNESLSFGNSLEELLYRITRVLAPKKVLVAGPSPDIHGMAASSSGGEVSRLQAVRDADLSPDTDAVIAHLGGIDMLIMANPNRITGRLIPQGEIDRLLQEAERKGAFVVLDESLAEFAGRGDVFGCPGDAAIVLRTTAFFYGLAGLELAYAASSPAVAEKLSTASCGQVNHLAVEACRAALRDKTYQKQAGGFVQAEKLFFSRECAKIPGVRMYASESNVFILHLPEAEDRVRAALCRAGFLVRDCEGEEGPGRSFLRVSVMSHESNCKFMRIVKENLPSRP